MLFKIRNSTWIKKNNKLEHSFRLELRAAWNLICHQGIVSANPGFRTSIGHKLDCHWCFLHTSANTSAYCTWHKKLHKGMDEGPAMRLQQWSLESRETRTSLATRILENRAWDIRTPACAALCSRLERFTKLLGHTLCQVLMIFSALEIFWNNKPKCRS